MYQGRNCFVVINSTLLMYKSSFKQDKKMSSVLFLVVIPLTKRVGQHLFASQVIHR